MDFCGNVGLLWDSLGLNNIHQILWDSLDSVSFPGAPGRSGILQDSMGFNRFPGILLDCVGFHGALWHSVELCGIPCCSGRFRGLLQESVFPSESMGCCRSLYFLKATAGFARIFWHCVAFNLNL